MPYALTASSGPLLSSWHFIYTFTGTPACLLARDSAVATRQPRAHLCGYCPTNAVTALCPCCSCLNWIGLMPTPPTAWHSFLNASPFLWPCHTLMLPCLLTFWYAPRIVTSVCYDSATKRPTCRTSTYTDASDLQRLFVTFSRRGCRRYHYGLRHSADTAWTSRISSRTPTAYLRNRYRRFDDIPYVIAHHRANPLRRPSRTVLR